jgi:hypothetical protein
MRRHHDSLAWLLLAALAVPGLAGCGPDGAAAATPAPASLRPITGSQLHEVVLTAEAFRQLGITTTPVRQVGALTEIPVTAVIYDPQGRSWAYTVPAALTCARQPITIVRTVGATTQLSAGPPAGTPVVDVGVPELLGTEYGVGEE